MAGEVMVEDPKNATGNGPASAAEKEGEVVLDPSSCDAVEGGTMDRSVQIHPLEHLWTFWYDQPSSSRSRQVAWGSTIRQVYTFATVEDFWGLYNNIKHPSKLTTGADFHCFKKGIEPKWEDPICENGGKWTISCPKGKVDAWWLHTLLAMIGEHFDHGDEICGAVVNIRAKQDKISIWTKNGSDKASQTSIGKQWKEVLDYNETIGYILHDHAKQYDRSAKSVHQV